ncbi:MAG: SusC/RagA family TonB-linked outer membrane protein [Rikenellaceae bacterium]|nr:SusC/RagA family TonB-linked outer membrane protein [Rikenellaceae bacterium]MCL2692325.1 SusC/RagA family TonB-linked outer membrane protein [Rikenellaceae bacterium]
MKKKDTYHHFPSGKFRKSLLMKLKLALILCCMGTVTVNASYSQHQRLNVTYENRSITSILEDLRIQTGLRAAYLGGLTLDAKTVSLSLTDATIEQVLEVVLGRNGYTYRIQDSMILIGEQSPAAQQQQPAATPPGTITGTVVDQGGAQIVGVSIAVVGTTMGTITDTRGNFTLRGVPLNVILRVSYLGKKQVEITYTGQQVINVRMEDDIATISEVVVTGFFERAAESFTGSASTFSGTELRNVSTQNVFQALRSLDPAFVVIPNDRWGSDPNRLPDIDIRGKTSIEDPRNIGQGDPNQPLFILDGFEASLAEINNLDMNRIASVTLLKDAASTAIYGAKAANGVLVIETVKPQAGQLRISYGGSASVSWADLTSYNLMNAEEKLRAEVLSGVYRSNYSQVEYDRLELLYNRRLENVLSGVDTYWLKVPLRTGLTHRHNIDIGGGDRSFTYGLGLSYARTEGVMKKSGNENMSVNMNLSYRTADGNFSFRNLATVTYHESWNPPVSFTDYARTNPYLPIFEGADQPRFLEEELIVVSTAPQWYRTPNPLYNESLTHINDSQSLRLRNNFYAEWRPTHGLMATIRFQISPVRAKTENFLSRNHTSFVNTVITDRGRYSKSMTDGTDYSGDFMLTYNKIIAERHQIFANATMNLRNEKTIRDGYVAIGFADDLIPKPSFAGRYPGGDAVPSYSENVRRAANIFMQTGYMYMNRYSLDLTVRRDGSNSFGSDNLFTTTWSGGVAWNIHREAWMEGRVNMLKLRATMGYIGNANSSFATMTTYRYNTQSNLYGVGLNVDKFGVYHLDWEKVFDQNLGLDFATLNNRFSSTVDVYRKVTDPLVISHGAPPSTGRNEFLHNMGRSTVHGITFKANYNIVHRPQDRFIWSVGVNGQAKKARFSKMDGLDALNQELRNVSSMRRYYNGGSPYSIWAVKSAGIDPARGDELFIKPDGTYTWRWSSSDEQIIGNSDPKIQGTLNTALRYKGWTANVNMRYIWRQDKFNSQLMNKVEGMDTNNMILYNQDKRALYGRWHKVGDVTPFRRINDLITPVRRTSRWMQTENTLRGESISVGYSFADHAWLKNANMNNLTLTVFMHDVFDWSSIIAERGIDYPFARAINLSVNISF